MLKALKMWRDSARHDADSPSPEQTGSPQAGAALHASGWRPMPGLDLDESDCLPLLEVGPAKEAFLRAVCRDLSGARTSEDLLADVEGYFRRHAGVDLMVAWGWESIEAAPYSEEMGESLQAIIARSMVEAGVRMVTLVIEGHVATNKPRSLIERLQQAEWSVRRADQTLFIDEDEVLASRLPPDGRPRRPAERRRGRGRGNSGLVAVLPRPTHTVMLAPSRRRSPAPCSAWPMIVSPSAPTTGRRAAVLHPPKKSDFRSHAFTS
jgi:hypothetical protein